MNGPLATATAREDSERRRNSLPAGDTRPAPGVLDTIAAGFQAARADTTGMAEASQVDAYQPVISALLELQPDATFARYISPSTGTVNPQSVWSDVERFRKQGRFSELPQTLAEFEQQWRTARRTEIERAEDVAGRGNVIAAFTGGVAGALTDPVNIATLPIGGTGKTVGARLLTEGLANAGIELFQQPNVQRQREALDRRDLTPQEAALNVAFAAVGGAAIRGGIEVAPGAGRVVNDRVIQPFRRAIDPDLDDKQLAKAFAKQVPENLRTPEQEAALQIVNRSIEVEDVSPFVRSDAAVDVHVSRMEAALRALDESRVPSPDEIAAASSPVVRASPLARPAARSFDREGVKAAIRGPESGGDDSAVNRAGSSASGRYQFIEGTFVGLYRREFGVSEAEARRAWLRDRFDVSVQERLMDRLLDDNSAALTRAGIDSDAGNLYLAHFAGSGKAVELLRAPDEAPVSAFFTPTAIRQNRTFLGDNADGTPKTVAQAIDAIRGAVGDPAQRSPVSLDPQADLPALRDPALDEARPFATLAGREVPVMRFSSSDIDVDAALMQFKSGGDAFGVTDRLRGIERFDDFQAGTVTVWEGLDGRRLIADGHQRLGLAKRISAQTGEDIGLNAYVLREADGFTASDARLWTAVKNVSEGSGTKIDAAKILRELVDDPETLEEVLSRLPRTGEFMRDARALFRLGDEAFGAIVNEVIPENFGAAIGQLVDDPALHMGMVRVLADIQPANRRQAEAIIRQALDAGFVKETQESLFGSEQLMTGLFAQRAKLLDRALTELKRLKGAFGVAVRNADTLEAGGNRIDVAGSAAEVEANALALAMVNALALRKGNAVNALLTRSAERIAAGEQPAVVLREFIGELRKLDLEAIAREGADDSADGIGGGAARGGADGAGADAPDAAEFDGPGLFGRDEPTPAEIDAREAARPFSDHTNLPPDPDPRFAEPDAPGIKAVADSVWHDIDAATGARGAPDPDVAARGAIDPNIAARQAQTAQLGAEAPLRGENRTGQAQDGEAGTPLFDAVDQKTLFDLGDGRGDRSLADIRAEIDADRSAIEEIKKCLF